MRAKNIFWGIFFICAAAMVVLSQLGYFADVGLFSILLTVLLIPLAVRNIFRLNFYGFLFPLAFLFLIYAGPLGLEISFWTLMAATLFLSMGLSLIFKRRRFMSFGRSDAKHGGGMENFGNDALSFSESFSSSTKYITSDDFKKARFSCSFGSMKVYFDNARISPEGARIMVNASFAAMEFYVPRHWNVINHIDPAFGHVDNLYRAYEQGGPTLEFTGECAFGSVRIVYV